MSIQETGDARGILANSLPLIAVGAAFIGAFWYLSLLVIDIFPINYYRLQATIFFWMSLAIVFFVVQFSAVSAWIADRLNRLAEFAERRGAFFSDSGREMPKFALIRIGFGVFMLDRVMAIAWRTPYSDWLGNEVGLLLTFSLVLTIMVLVGFLTQIALVMLPVFQWQFMELVLGTSTLGNDIAAILAMLLLFANAGAHYSVDAQLRRSPGMLGRFVAKLYYTNGLPASNVLQIAKIFALCSYWMICLYSLSMHLSEEAWMTGTAGPLLLSNNFMSRLDVEFVALFQSSETAVWLARVSLWLMLPWYALVFPAVMAGGIFRTYAIIWGILFFCLSMFVLQLGWLAEFEFLFWLALFWSFTLIGQADDLQVAYDDRCNLCDRTINFIRRVDWFGRVKLRPLSENKDWLEANGISLDSASKDLYGVDARPGEECGISVSGYRFYELLTRRIALLSPAYPFLVIGRWIGIGPAVYRYIADRRTKLFGVCELPTPKPDQGFRPAVLPAKEVKAGNPVTVFAAHLGILFICFLLAMPARFLDWKGVPFPQPVKQWVQNLSDAAHIYGVAPIDVFNMTDLRMSENWFTLEEEAVDGSRRMLPVFNALGHRLELHRSDRFYFGHTLRFRRAVIGRDECFLDEYRDMLRYLAEHELNDRLATTKVIYKQYLQPLAPSEALLEGKYLQDKPKVVCEGVL